MIKFDSAPIYDGMFTIHDIIKSEAGIVFTLTRENIKKSGFIFSLIDESSAHKFSFSLVVSKDKIEFQRNGFVLNFSIKDMPINEMLLIVAQWDAMNLELICTYGLDNKQKQENIITPLTIPPNTLLRWARVNNLIPVVEYASEEEFCTKVYSCLQSIQDKINESGATSQFWNNLYENKKLIKRDPKRETEIHPIIHSMLSDQFCLASIEIIPEFRSGVGSLDFLFIGRLKNYGNIYFAAEFKNAHSDNLESGLLKQLPAYMESKKAKYGAYCVLNYKSEDFIYPKEKTKDDLEFYLINLKLGSINPYLEKCRIIIYTLSKPTTASLR